MTESHSPRATAKSPNDSGDGLLAPLVSLLQHRELLFGMPVGLFVLVVGLSLLSTRNLPGPG